MSAVGAAVLFYDHACTFFSEIHLIWTRPLTITKLLFLSMRYSIAVGHILLIYTLSGLAETTPDKLSVLVCIPAQNTDAYITKLPVLLVVRVYALWDHRKSILRTLTVGYVIAAFCTAGTMLASTADLARSTFFEGKIFHMCLLDSRPKLWSGIWISQVAFHLFVFVLTVFNATDRPRQVSSPLITDLRKDGGLFYVAMIMLRLANLILGLLPGDGLFLMAVWFVWAMAAVTVTRLTLKVEAMLRTIQDRAPYRGASIEIELR
ncbi:hypothetical protein FA95DRAFT_930300 [Auriscalpium vulgare]|uniref:Uncharacterized protein n=1 Tax=Auriscalpium vulgare TaxID=40419 RepID=A0ACB8R7H6_9AGAM|nr:hypothetical protein FA95DRAFT_930300 [Auriscalpium vulgare]